MNSTVNYIRQRLSLRKPLTDALEITSRITDELSLQQPPKALCPAKKPPTGPDMLEMFIAVELPNLRLLMEVSPGDT